MAERGHMSKLVTLNHHNLYRSITIRIYIIRVKLNSHFDFEQLVP